MAGRKKAGWLTRIIRRNRPLVPHVRLKGAIGMPSALNPGLTAAGVEPLLKQAFSVAGAAAVAISVNSPGGSPVQSTLIFRRIRQLAAENDIKVLVFCEDVAASGGYMLAVAGDEIFCDRSSILGSIGVVSASFGFPEAIRKIGVERRVYTAGRNKVLLDPFLPEKKESVEHLKSLQLDVHQAFIDIVRERRAARLVEDKADDLFSGLFWSGARAVELGLADRIGLMHKVLKDRFGDKVVIKEIGRGSGFSLRRLIWPGPSALEPEAAAAIAARLADGALDGVEQRALWSRFGL